MVLACWKTCQRLNLDVGIALIVLQHHTQFVLGQAESRFTYSAPIVVPISEDWEGNDGPWSTFALQIGTPPQTVKVLASTASNEIWAIAPEGCQLQLGDPTGCESLRGEFYNYSASSTWDSNLSNASTNIYPLSLESSLNYTGNGRYGFDDITLGYIGSGGPTLKNQTIAGIATKSFFMGLFGLTPRSSNFTSLNNPIPSFIQNLRNQSMIPSLSWAYTAGNQYRLNKVFGSLVLGGYDSSRFIPNNLTFQFSVDTELATGLDAITTGTGVSLLPSPIKSISLDSTVPYIYLPTEACVLFENAFDLTWNDTAELYLLNDTQYSALKTQNPNITFTLGTSPMTVDITLPYSAFDLTASWPLAANATPYFPLKRGLNETQYTLGRTFFQEAYVIADYEKGNFSISQCKWDIALAANIVAIPPPSNSTNSTPTSTSTSTTSHALPTGGIVGVAVGGAAILFVVSMLFYLRCFKPRRERKRIELPADSHPEEFMKAELDNTGIFSPPIYEAEGQRITPVVEIGDPSEEHIYELPAREETAVEMNGLSESRLTKQRNEDASRRRWVEESQK